MIVSTEEALDSPRNDRTFLRNDLSFQYRTVRFTQNTTTFFKEGWHNFKEIVTFLLGSDVPSGPPYRTGSALDFINSDHCIHVSGINLTQKHNLRRKKYDSQINEHGKSLLEICKTCDMRIVNGRTPGDSFGRITCHSPKGIGTVDYFIVSHEMLSLIGNFIVKEPTIFSDHSQPIC